MTTSSRLRNVDARVWRTATWAAPFTIQAVLGLGVGITWLVGRHPSNTHGFGQYAIGAGATFLLLASVGFALLRQGSPRAHGIAISLAGSFVVALVGATAYGSWIIGW